VTQISGVNFTIIYEQFLQPQIYIDISGMQHRVLLLAIATCGDKGSITDVSNFEKN